MEEGWVRIGGGGMGCVEAIVESWTEGCQLRVGLLWERGWLNWLLGRYSMVLLELRVSSS